MSPAREEFLKHVDGFEMTVGIDAGMHRHLTFKKPDTYNRHFHITTWPGYLAISGDMDSFIFSRLPDMFEFFRGSEINTGYWSEKLTATAKHRGHMEFSEEKFQAAIKSSVDEWDCKNRAERKAVWREIEETLHFEQNDMIGSVRRVMDYECPITKNRFHDFWDHRFEDYTYGFVWCCYAIQWAIQQYDAARLRTSSVASNDSQTPQSKG